MGTNYFSSQTNKSIDHCASLLAAVENKTTSVTLRKEEEEVLPTAEGLIRLREFTEELSLEEDNDHDLTKFPQQSLHSFQFSTINHAHHARNDLILKKKKYGTLPGHHIFTKQGQMTDSRNNKPKTVDSPIIMKHIRRKSLPPISESPPPLPQLPPISEISTTTTSRTMSNSSSNSSTTITNTDEDDEEETYVPHLHNRLKQQNQAILTTYDDWRIILTNSIAQDVLVSHLHPQCNQAKDMLLVGKSVMDLVEPYYQKRLEALVVKRRTELLSDGNMVLVCGNVIPIIKLDGTKTSASLWLKEKMNDSGSSVFIWIFEEVYESSVTLSVNSRGEILSIEDEEGIRDLYNYKPNQLLNHPLDILIPALKNKSDWQAIIEEYRFFSSQTEKGAQFPIIARVERKETTVQLKITSMPMIAGLMTIKNGIIEGCNDIFVKYLFGFSQQELRKSNISTLLPQFNQLLTNLKRDDLLQPGLIINNIICRKLIQQDNNASMLLNKSNKERLLTHTPNNQPLPIMIAVHRDGTPLEVQLQLKLVESSLEEEYAIWISFDREIAFKRYGHPLLISQRKEKTKDEIVHSPTNTVIPPLISQEQQKKNRSPEVITISGDITSPPLIQSTIKEKEELQIQYAAQTKATTIDDYHIIDSLGQGAYGFVKLAVRKNDPSQTKLVIKYVIKSRILVDCWTRDRKLGTVPVEVHILHTLRKSPHENLCDMLDYFEDADHYYIVMGLHGEGMDLFDYIELNDRIEETEVQRIFRQIAKGVCHLHDNKIVHRDIKDENVVLDQEHGGLRLIDFGSAAYIKPGRKYETFVGTLDYAAPEILKGLTYSGKPQDVWALGILLFTLIYRENPFYDIDEIMSRELRIPFILSEGSVDLISKMLEREVDKRIDIHQVLAHPWLN